MQRKDNQINFVFPQYPRLCVLYIATDKYRAGYTDCAREVAKYLSTPEPPPLPSVPSITDPGCKARLLRHLDQCILEIDTEICPVGNSIGGGGGGGIGAGGGGIGGGIGTNHVEIKTEQHYYVPKKR